MTHDYEKSRITVVADDRMVIVDGVAHQVDIAFDRNLHALQWDADAPGVLTRGHISRKHGDSHGFTDFDTMKPFVEAWERAHQVHLEQMAKIQRQADEVQAKIKAEQDAIEAERQRQAKMAEEIRLHNEAHFTLTTTDHEILKAVEALLQVQLSQAMGEWPQVERPAADAVLELIKRRQAARETIKQERARLGIK